jgi:hypothetical protein
MYLCCTEAQADRLATAAWIAGFILPTVEHFEPRNAAVVRTGVNLAGLGLQRDGDLQAQALAIMRQHTQPSPLTTSCTEEQARRLLASLWLNGFSVAYAPRRAVNPAAGEPRFEGIEIRSITLTDPEHLTLPAMSGVPDRLW